VFIFNLIDAFVLGIKLGRDPFSDPRKPLGGPD
jgi:hypothetical protein